MRKLGKWSASLAAIAGLFFVMTRPAVIENSPEPMRSALMQLSSDFEKTVNGKGFESKKKNNGSGYDEGIPLLRSHGVSR
jgi:hypothetical protein